MQWSEFRTVIMLMRMWLIYYLFINRYDGPEEDSAMDEDGDHLDVGVGVVVVDGMAELGMGPSAVGGGSASGGSISGKRKR